MAHHYREAGVADAASTYFERAGDRAAARSGYIEATAHFRAAIEQADRLSQKDERARRALTLLLKLGPAIAVTIGQWKPEVEAVYRRAHELGREVDDGPQLFRLRFDRRRKVFSQHVGNAAMSDGPPLS